MPQQDPLAAIGGIPATPVTQQDPLAAIGGIPDTSAPLPSPQPGLLTRAANVIGEAGAGLVPGAVESTGETLQSLPYIGKKIISPEAMQAEREYFKPGSAAEKAGQGIGAGMESILEFVLGDEALKGLAIADKVGIASKISKIAQDSPYIGALLRYGVTAARTGTVGGAEALAKGATPSQAAATGVATGLAGGTLEAASEAIGKILPKNPFRALRLGKSVEQAPAAAAVRTAVGVGEKTPILAGTETAATEPLADLETKKSAAYKQIDDTVGFDLKAEKEHLADTQYAIKQPGADKAALQTEINESTQRIADANTKLAAAKIDPKAADNLNTAWSAGKQYKQLLVRATNPDGTLKTSALLNGSKNLRFNPKYGDRLAQFFGKGDVVAGKAIAEEYMNGLAQAQKDGLKALNFQQLAKTIGTTAAKAIGYTTLAGLTYEGVKHLIPGE